MCLVHIQDNNRPWWILLLFVRQELPPHKGKVSIYVGTLKISHIRNLLFLIYTTPKISVTARSVVFVPSFLSAMHSMKLMLDQLFDVVALK